MRSMLMLVFVFMATSISTIALRTDDTTGDAIASRMAVHQETAGLRETSKAIVRANGATCSAGGSLGRIQSLFLDVASSEPNLDVTAVEIQRAPEAQLRKGVSSLVEYTVEYVAAPDERVAKARWAIPILLNAIQSATVSAKSLTIVTARLGSGSLTLEGRSQNRDASKAVQALLDPGPTHLVKTVTIEQKTVTELVQDEVAGMPQRRVTIYAFKVTAAYDATSVALDALKRAAFN